MTEKKDILFICNHNAGRSQMAEAFLNNRYGNKYQAFSAGVNPSEEINKITISVLKESGIDISDKKTKNISEFNGKVFDTVVLMCDCERESVEFPKTENFIRKVFSDPYVFSGNKDEITKGFRNVRDDISGWIDETFRK
ncbi:arsenate reductase ArsC [Methanoplanus sp. FWC-SCC4]|uniref:Arsenate reductase ArsC n=1 Tax=Methanochimaera problematica TaxID=2609417 RepID=A0AA97I4Z5_9EURY|nr:arsenate reductase ArsC [Methanoplanus sp. FWC-SCC4]WOF16906.1 arsenate reductase ArsC [Methanoplanus sp. FWC-SCC4]